MMSEEDKKKCSEFYRRWYSKDGVYRGDKKVNLST